MNLGGMALLYIVGYSLYASRKKKDKYSCRYTDNVILVIGAPAAE